MNHPAGMPYGQMPMNTSHRRHDAPYSSIPPSLRSQTGYTTYYPSQMGPPMHPYQPHYPPHWYQFQNMPYHGPPQPSRHYQSGPPQHPNHYAPLVVPPYPPPQPPPTSVQGPPPSHPRPNSTAVPTHSPALLRAPFSPPPQSASSSTNIAQGTPSSTASSPSEHVSVSSTTAIVPLEPFFPPVPWLSVDDQSFPRRASRGKRRIVRSALSSEPIIFPAKPADTPVQPADQGEYLITIEDSEPVATPNPHTSDAPSDTASTQPTTPSSVIIPQPAKVQQTQAQPRNRPVLPVIPAIPVLPTSPTTARRVHRDSALSATSKTSANLRNVDEAEQRRASNASLPTNNLPPPEGLQEISKPASNPPPPKSWADLVRSKAPPIQNSSNTSAQVLNGLGPAKSESLSDVLNSLSPNFGKSDSKISFLKPRGLVNTGMLCYMNSVLQILVFCVPFYDFLDRIARKAVHNFKSDTPVIDAMILFMQEFSIIDSADSGEQLRLRLKPEDFENFGTAFVPEYVYSAIKELPRFRDMRRGHQQDAQEFLGLLLEELHEECAQAMRSGSSVNSGTSTPREDASVSSAPPDTDGGWMEVGHKQKPSITRSSGTILTESPVTKIFGGKLRSEWKVSGNKISVTLEPYQALPLDIGSAQVNNIVDALKGLTRPESMQGDFHSPRGPKTSGTKQVFIEKLPPVLILHLKRFHYDNSMKRSEKIWKKIGYPLELEIPKEVFPPQVRNRLAASGGLPKYRLIGVIYHHGKSTNGGHYTVDIRRQDSREWVRLDDQIIRRVRSEDVAEAGSEEDSKTLAAALEQHKQQKPNSGNIYDQIENEEKQEDAETDNAWSQVNGHSRSKSNLSAIVNGSLTPRQDASGRQTPNQKASMKDNKVAYLLFYQHIAS